MHEQHITLQMQSGFLSDLHGVFAPIVTPFRPADGEVDLPWIKDYLAYLRAHGCDGIVPCGTNGEAPSLSVDERRRVVDAALSTVEGMMVVPGTGAAALPDAIALTRHAFSAGVDAVLVMPPFYYRHPSEDGVVVWYQRLFDAAVPSGGRVLLYHIPQTTGVPISDRLIRALLATHGEIVYGIKDSTGDPQEGRRLRETFPGLAYFAGNDHRVVEACQAGGAGSITACANVFPSLVAAAQRAAHGEGDPTLAQARLSAARSALDAFPLQPATKAALAEIVGLPPTAVRPPQIELAPAQREELRSALQFMFLS
jgi:4-hydroxy-tetrahydrodipicolinate synthase